MTSESITRISKKKGDKMAHFLGKSPLSPSYEDKLYKLWQTSGGGAGNTDNEALEKAKRAVQMLIKRLKLLGKKPEDFFDIVSKQDITRCFIVPFVPHQDIARNVVHLHLLCCQLYRFASVTVPYHLKPVEGCQQPYLSNTQDKVCINPFHYERLEATTLQPVTVPHTQFDETSHSRFIELLEQTHMETTTTVQNQNITAGFDPRGFASNNVFGNLTNAAGPISPNFAHNSPHSVGISPSPDSQSPHAFMTSPPSFGASPASAAELMSDDNDTHGMNSPSSNCPDSPPHPNTTGITLHTPTAVHTPGTNHLQADNSENTSVPFVEPTYWCSIQYFEMGSRVGEPFHVDNFRDSVSVDGGCDPSSPDRFCLGMLANITRSKRAEEVRRSIGQGIRLYCIAGEVYVECCSEGAIFVQSPICNMRYQWHPATVVKIPPGCNLKLFTNEEFRKILAESVDKGYESVYQLSRMCTIRISFVKGWGEAYTRQMITSCPCWCEIHLNGPLQWLDRVLTQMGTPGIQCSSQT